MLLIILDGVGIGPKIESNAVFLAKKPNLDRIFASPLYRELKAHGTAVGMPSDEDMGNSEVGHNALGAGRVFPQGATLASNAIESGRLFQTQTWKDAMAVKGTLHFLGLLSDGNVHSHIDHLISMIEKAAQSGVKKVRIHILLDGRDVDQKSALRYIEKLENFLKKYPGYKIASGGGRMVTTMDRYNADWSIVERGWNAHVLGIGQKFQSASEAVQSFYKDGITDQYMPSFVIDDAGIQDGDAVINFNFRGDRMIEISQAFEQTNFDKFDRKRVPNILYVGMTQYDGDLQIPKHFLVEPPAIENPIGKYLCAEKITSFAISETQKFGHVTYFWNGNNSGYIDPNLETYIEIPSDKIPFDQAPVMKAFEITDKTIDLLNSGKYQFGRLNFPNGDMVGHTGSVEATVASIEATDHCVGLLVNTVNALGGISVILADHGNADEMFVTKDGIRLAKTSHTLNPVPFVIVDQHNSNYRLRQLSTAGLANVAATLCNLLGFEAPAEYEPSLIEPV